MNILVVSAYEDRRKKYTDEYQIISAVWWEDIKDEDLKTYHFYWNARDSHKKKVVACSKSHKKAIQHIIDNDLKNTIIIEDDAILDIARLDELKDYDDFTFVGGDIRPPLVKDDKSFNKSMINKSGFKLFKPSILQLSRALSLLIVAEVENIQSFLDLNKCVIF